jgi:hypothetical protein
MLSDLSAVPSFLDPGPMQNPFPVLCRGLSLQTSALGQAARTQKLCPHVQINSPNCPGTPVVHAIFPLNFVANVSLPIRNGPPCGSMVGDCHTSMGRPGRGAKTVRSDSVWMGLPEGGGGWAYLVGVRPHRWAMESLGSGPR